MANRLFVIAVMLSTSCASVAVRKCPPCPPPEPPQVVKVPVSSCPQPVIPAPPAMAIDAIDPDTSPVNDIITALAVDRERLRQWANELLEILKAYSTVGPDSGQQGAGGTGRE